MTAIVYCIGTREVDQERLNLWETTVVLKS